MNVVSIDFEAADEFVAATDWYNDQRADLGDEFLADAQAAARALPRRLVHRVLDDHRHLGVHLAPLAGWPYRLIYVIKDSSYHVIALAHERRVPGYWSHRLGR